MGGLTIAELTDVLRLVVREEATPEGWAVERTRLEKRVAMQDEQLRTSKTHQDQTRDAHRAQLGSLHSQLAEAQLLTSQLRERNAQYESERQMWEWERNSSREASEMELQQCRQELHTLRQEERSLRDRLTKSEAAQQRAEGAVASVTNAAELDLHSTRAELHQCRLDLSQARQEEHALRDRLSNVEAAYQIAQGTASAVATTTAAMQSLESRLKEKTEDAHGLKQEVSSLQEELRTVAALRADEALALCQGIMAVAYLCLQTALPEQKQGFLVDSDSVNSVARRVCQRCVRSYGEQLRNLRVSTSDFTEEGYRGTLIGDHLDWDGVQAQALDNLPLPLPAADNHAEQLQTEIEHRESLQREVERLRLGAAGENAGRQAELQGLEARVSQEQNEVARLQKELVTRAAQEQKEIARLQQEITERETQEQHMQLELTQRVAQEHKEVVRLQQELASRTAHEQSEIPRLMQELAVARANVESERQLKERSAELEKSRHSAHSEELARCKSEAQQHLQALQQRDDQIRELKEHLERQSAAPASRLSFDAERLVERLEDANRADERTGLEGNHHEELDDGVASMMTAEEEDLASCDEGRELDVQQPHTDDRHMHDRDETGEKQSELERRQAEEHEREQARSKPEVGQKEPEIERAEEVKREQERSKAEELEREQERLKAEELEEQSKAEELGRQQERKIAEEHERDQERLEAEELEREQERSKAEELEREQERKRAEKLEQEAERVNAERLKAEEEEWELQRQVAEELERERKRLEDEELEREQVRLKAEEREREEREKVAEALILEEQRKKTEGLERSLKKQESQKGHLGSVTGAKPAGRPPPRSSVSSNLFDSDDDDASMLAPKAKAPAATAKTPAKVVPSQSSTNNNLFGDSDDDDDDGLFAVPVKKAATKAPASSLFDD